MNEELMRRAEELLEKLTLEEKIGMIHGAELFATKGVERLGIPPLRFSDGTMGVRQEFAPDSWHAVGNTDDFVTYLPCGSAVAATWNRSLAKMAGSVLGAEARGRGKDVILGPGINIKRSPLCGRNFEYFSEDPYLTGQLAAAFVQGVQQWDVAACVKHFAANNQETKRLQVEVEIDEEALRSLYLPAFYETVKEGGTLSVMAAYNRLYGEHCCQSDFLLRKILRQEWGFDGLVVSDWGGVHDTKLAAQSSLDVEMSVTNDFDQYKMAEPLKKLVEAGEIPESAIDEKVFHILMTMMRLHMLDGSRKSGSYNTREHQNTALMMARESVVLLKNSQGILPLRKEACHRILVIGENGNRIHSNGGGSAEVKALYEITPLMGIKKLLGGNCRVDYVPGYCSDGFLGEDAGLDGSGDGQAENWQETSLENGGGSIKVQREDEAARRRRQAMRQEASALAASSQYDKVIFVGGLNHDFDSEGNDRADMKLPYDQDVLIGKLLSVRPDMVMVLMGGSPVEMGRWVDRCSSLVWCWYGGMEGGTALAEVLFGQVNPSGKLPESFYQTIDDCSAHSVGEFPGTDKVRYREGVFVGYRYLDTFGKEPQFCFGHGLSYTEFTYGKASLGKASLSGEGNTVLCEITNTGCLPGKETVQVYLRQKERNPKQPYQELAGFEKIELQPGETRQVIVAFKGEFKGREIAVGSSSRDIRAIVCSPDGETDSKLLFTGTL